MPSDISRFIAPGALLDGDLVLEFAGLLPHPVHKVPTYFFRMVRRDSGVELGKINLRSESNPHIELYAGHIGYEVHVGHRGHRYASRALRLLMPLARELALDPLWITTDPPLGLCKHRVFSSAIAMNWAPGGRTVEPSTLIRGG